MSRPIGINALPDGTVQAVSPMRAAELCAALSNLPADVQITLSVRAGDLRAALEAKQGGPLEMDAEQAAQWLGRSPEYWRRAAKSGRITGAYQEHENGKWHLPRPACQQHLEAAQRRHARRSRTDGSVIPLVARRARGPRKA